MEHYCDCHQKHVASISRIEQDMKDYHAENKSDHNLLWDSVKQKLSLSWLIIMVPIILGWVGFQLVIYDSIKNVETKIAVVETEIKAYMKENGKEE